MGIDFTDSHHPRPMPSVYQTPGGATYLSDGVFHRTQVETAAGPVRNVDGAIYRFEAAHRENSRLTLLTASRIHMAACSIIGAMTLLPTPLATRIILGRLSAGILDYPHKHGGMKEFWDRPSRPCPGTGFLSSRQFLAVSFRVTFSIATSLDSKASIWSR